MPVQTATKNPAILSYYTLARMVGAIALSLPFLLTCGNIALALLRPGHALPQPLLERSISDYYYTSMGSYYVGSLCVIATFLMCARGYDRSDEIAGYLAGLFALGVAFFPSENPFASSYTKLEIEIGYVHTTFAALMFLAIAYFCLFLFPRSSPQARLTRRKQHRNRIYLACGAAIVVCNCAMVILTLKAVAAGVRPGRLLLLCESLALMAFGIAWLTKGKGILRDKPQDRQRTL